MKIIFGIDPGLSGAIARIDVLPDGSTAMREVLDMPFVEVERYGKLKREVSGQAVADCIRRMRFMTEHDLAKLDEPGTSCHAYLERVNAMPGQGVTSVFSFGRSSGIIEGVLAGLAIPITIITPQRWQKAMSVRDGKDGSRARAAELYPSMSSLFALKKHDGRADAVLIASYGARQ